MNQGMTPDEFLPFVRAYVAAHPEVAAHVADYAQAGLRVALDQAYQRAADMEVALVAATAHLKNGNAVILDKLTKWHGKTSCNWDSLIKKLDSRG